MDAAMRARLVVAFAALVVLWIVVYWVWEPRSAGVSFARDPGPAAQEPELPFAGEGIQTSGAPRAAAPARPSSDVGTDAGSESKPDPTGTGETRASQEPQRVPAGVIAPEFRDYVVREKDTFAVIARRIYGDASRAGAIARANPFKDPTRLRPGQIIRVPVDPENVQGIPLAEGVGAEADAREYVVQKGDTLGSIARAHYGSIRYADSIFEANRDVLKSRNSIRVGQKLVLPPHPERGS